MRDEPDDAEDAKTAKRKCVVVLVTLFIMVGGVILALLVRFRADIPVDYAGEEDHFKYGSTGGERASGFPYWIWKALPTACEKDLPNAQRFPGQELKAFGFLYEGTNDLPIGMSKRRHMGLDRVFLNCAVCHTSTVRDKPGASPKIITGMPANTVDLMAFEKFLFACAKNSKFSPEYLIPEIQRMSGKHLKALDRYVVYPFAIYLMRDRLLMLEDRFSSMLEQPPWGPGRVDTFGSAKALLNFPMEHAPKAEVVGVTDFPSIWLQGPRRDKQMHLHWDGNNDKVEERNRSAAFGTGATPATLDRPRIKRIEEWLWTLRPPAYPYPIEPNLAAKGASIYKHYCAGCHGIDGRNFDGAQVGQVTYIQDIKTDPHRLDSYTRDLAVNQNLLYAETGDKDERFSHFKKTFGYANMPLDGLWLRAPYLHNGSVPTLRDLLEPTARRPKIFYRGNDLYDQAKVGFVSTADREGDRTFYKFDTAVVGNSNVGHEGKQYGTDLPPGDKDALVEFLKTF